MSTWMIRTWCKVTYNGCREGEHFVCDATTSPQPSVRTACLGALGAIHYGGWSMHDTFQYLRMAWFISEATQKNASLTLTLRIDELWRWPLSLALALLGSRSYKNLLSWSSAITSGNWERLSLSEKSAGSSEKIYVGNNFAKMCTWFDRIDLAPSRNCHKRIQWVRFQLKLPLTYAFLEPWFPHMHAQLGWQHVINLLCLCSDFLVTVRFIW